MSKSLSKGIIAGVVGGLVGSVALRAWMTAVSSLHRGTTVPDRHGPAHQVGSLVAEKLGRKPLSPRELLVVGEVVHYLFGAFSGAIYGGLAEYQPWTTAGMGMLFGTGVFVAADESSLPLLRLVPPPSSEAPAARMEHWGAHLVFGVTSEVTRRKTRGLL